MDKLQEIILIWGARKSLILLSLFATAASGFLTYLFITLIWGDDPIYKVVIFYSFLVSLVVPALVAPIIISIILKLLFKVHELEKQTRFLATYDVLTGLLSRRAFYEGAEKQLKLTIRNQQSIAFLVADLDGFKTVNDTYGHYMGDKLLKHVGKIIAENARESDLAGRLGGDEFIFCLPNTTFTDAKNFGERLLDAIKQSEFKHEGKNVEYGVSIGMHVAKAESNAMLSELIHRADVALYKAKKEGKGRLR